MMKNKKNGIRTGKTVASDSGKLLSNKKTPSKLKSITASALGNRKK